MKIKNAGYAFVIFLVIYLYNIPVCAKEIPDELKNLYAQSAVLMDADSGRILFGKEEDKILPMASTTKIMTCILALENMQDGQIAIVSEYAQGQPKVRLGVKKGEKYYLKDLLYSMMLESHNDSAVIIAEAISGNVEEFADLMNRKAKEIGCKNTFFITPNGLDAEEGMKIHSTTAADLALIMRYCISGSPMKKEFIEITGEMNYQFTELSKKRCFTCDNHNRFLQMMEGALSGKTGFTNAAGYCYVGALRQGNRTFIAVVLACGWPGNKDYKWRDTKRIMKYALDNFRYKKINEEIGGKRVRVKNGIDPKNPLTKINSVETENVKENRSIMILLGKDESIEIQTILPESLNAPLKKNDVAGINVYLINGMMVHKSDIIINEDVNEKNVKNIWEFIKNIYLLQIDVWSHK